MALRGLRWLLLAALCGCAKAPSGQADGGIDAGLSISPVELCDRMATARCELLTRCHAAFNRDAPENYRSFEQSRCLSAYDGLRGSFQAQTVEVDSEKVVACESRMRTSACAAAFPPGYPADIAVSPMHDCELGTGLLRGKVRSGETCDRREDCAAGTVCIKAGGVCRGTCSAMPHPGDPCGFGCGPGLRCETQGTEDPSDDHCSPLLSVDAPCTQTAECAADLYCRSTCRPRGKLGEVCVFDPQRLSTCEAGLACDVTPFVPGALGMCRVPRGVGETCRFHWSCQPGLVCGGLDYQGFPNQAPAAGNCLPPSAEGAACSFTEFATFVGDECAAGLFCSGTTRTCARPPQRGEACTPSSQACVGLDVYCKPSGSGDTGVCSGPPQVGERCAVVLAGGTTLKVPCAAGFCETETTFSCLAPNKQDGMACHVDGECTSNRCAVHQDRSLRCAPACQ